VRLKSCLSAVLNFAKHREGRVELLEQLRAQSGALEQRCAQLEKENADKARLARAAARLSNQTRALPEPRSPAPSRRAERGAELSGRREGGRGAGACPPPRSLLPHSPQRLRELEAAEAAAAARLAQLEAACAVEEAAVRDLKAEGHDAASRCAALRARLAAARAEAQALRGQLVADPHSAVAALAEAQRCVGEERRRLGAAEAGGRDAAARAELLRQLAAELARCAEAAGEAAAAVAQRKEAGRVVKAARAAVAAAEAEAWRLSAETEAVLRQQATLGERQARMEQQGAVKLQAAAAALRAAQEEDAAGRATGEAAGERVAANAAAARALEAASAEQLRLHNRDLAAVSARFDTLMEAVRQYHMGLAERIDEEEEEEVGAGGQLIAVPSAALAMAASSPSLSPLSL